MISKVSTTRSKAPVRHAARIGVTLCLFVACRRVPVSLAPEQTAPAPVNVALIRVSGKTWPRLVSGSGSLFAFEEVSVGAEVAGAVVAIGPEVADSAEVGALLARISDTNYALQRDQRARALEESLARLGLSRLPTGAIDYEKLPSVESARLEAENAAMRFDRGRQLHARTPPLMSDQEIADLKTAADVAVSKLATARLEVSAAAAAIFTRRSELEVAEEQVRKTIHRAPPVGGPWVVADRMVAVGDYVAPGKVLYRLLDLDPLKLRVRIPERRLEGVSPGLKVTVTVAGRANAVDGRVLRLRPSVDERTRTTEVEIEVPNPGFHLRPGGFALAEIEVGEDKDVPVVPTKSLVVFAGIHKVMIADRDLAGEKLVTVGRRRGDEVEITSGLAVGDWIIAEPTPGLVLGTSLRLTKPAAEGAR